MRLAEFEPPRPGPDEVLVRVRAAASNALDWKMRNGEMKLMTGRAFPRAMGHDFAGVIEAVGVKQVLQEMTAEQLLADLTPEQRQELKQRLQ